MNYSETNFNNFIESRSLSKNISVRLQNSNLKQRIGFIYFNTYWIEILDNEMFYSMYYQAEFNSFNLTKVEEWLWNNFVAQEVNI